MSEQIVKFGGDTTARDLWEGGPTESTGMSRYLDPKNRSFSLVAWQQAKPIQDSELNLMQQMQNQLRADALRALLSSGVLSLDLTAGVTDRQNTLRIANAVANVNGWLIYMNGANRSDSLSDIVFPAAPYNGTREDLAFLETWFEEVAPSGSPEDDDENVYKYGGVNSGTLANDIEDSVAGDETTRRIQLRWNIRTVTDVNFVSYPDGVPNGDRVKARGGAAADTGYTYEKVADGLYRAGNGSAAACTSLKCVDGYTYAIPLYRVHRRNQTAYNAADNPAGAPAYASGVKIPSGLYHDVIAPADVTVLYSKAEPYHGDTETEKATLMTAMQKINGCEIELDKWQNQRIQQGEAVLYNKYVITGCVLNAIAGTRNIKLTRTGTYNAANYSTAYIDGQVVGIGDTQDSVAAVPTNDGAAAVSYFAYLDGTRDKGYAVKVGAEVPTGKLALYRITVPAGDTAANLDKVAFADIRRVEPSQNYYNTRPTASIVFPGYTAPDAPDYDVVLSPLSYDGRGAGLEVIERGQNGFTVGLTGEADNIRFRWTLINQVK